MIVLVLVPFTMYCNMSYQTVLGIKMAAIQTMGNSQNTCTVVAAGNTSIIHTVFKPVHEKQDHEDIDKTMVSEYPASDSTSAIRIVECLGFTEAGYPSELTRQQLADYFPVIDLLVYEWDLDAVNSNDKSSVDPIIGITRTFGAEVWDVSLFMFTSIHSIHGAQIRTSMCNILKTLEKR